LIFGIFALLAYKKLAIFVEKLCCLLKEVNKAFYKQQGFERELADLIDWRVKIIFI